jgi:hypothetical protein
MPAGILPNKRHRDTTNRHVSEGVTDPDAADPGQHCRNHGGVLRLMFQISEQARPTYNCQPERHRQVRCIWFLGYHHDELNIAALVRSPKGQKNAIVITTTNTDQNIHWAR